MKLFLAVIPAIMSLVPAEQLPKKAATSTKITTEAATESKSLAQRRKELVAEATNLALTLQDGTSVTAEVDEIAFSLRSEQEDGMDAAIVRLSIKKRGESQVRLQTQYIIFMFKDNRWGTVPDLFYVKTKN